ncbi:hypothetical protein GGR56DRAFT_628269 [Xylariaceae sp. FL0804]|nr:hypothetical protein GGR56DRAFT_628269 [Xylariaceae sp. FL0804]
MEAILPQEVLLLICQELATRRDFDTLFHCSLVGRRVAGIALEQLYGMRGVVDNFPEETRDIARMWRSIILSSIGETAFPYCAYVRALTLGNLEDCLEEMRSDSSLRSFFFDGAMEKFLVLREGIALTRKATRRTPLPPIDYQSTVIRCAQSITQSIKDQADINERAVALANLEGYFIPHDILPKWLARLGTLTSLQLRDGSVLGVEVASVLEKDCPNFCELTCYYYRSSTADEDMAAFFKTLRPNSLRKFEVISLNLLGEASMTALNTHAESLQILLLGTLSPVAMRTLNLLSSCTALETLKIENDVHGRTVFSDADGTILDEITAWISSCTSLRHLILNNVQDALFILKDVLDAPGMRLASLRVKDFQTVPSDIMKATWIALGLQDCLETLTLAEQDGFPDGLVLARNPELVDSICRLTNLTYLNLMEAIVSTREIRRFANNLPDLEELTFGGELVDESILEPLSAFPKIKSISISGASVFRFPGLRTFATKLDPARHSGISVDILNQWYETRLTDEEEKWLKSYFADHLDGVINIIYPRGPDELHDSDLYESD